MNNIFAFLYRNNFFFIFLILEICCIVIISKNKGYQGSKLINSSNELSANVYQFTANTKEYLQLKEENDRLAKENNLLKNQTKLGFAILSLKNYKQNDLDSFAEIHTECKKKEFDDDSIDNIEKQLYKFKQGEMLENW